MSVSIRGAERAHAKALRQILGGIEDPSFSSLRLEPRTLIDFDEAGSLGWEPSAEEIAAASGVAVVLEDPEPDLRGVWEARLVTHALADRCRAEGLTHVVSFSTGHGGSAVDGGVDELLLRPAPSHQDAARLRVDLTAVLESLDLDVRELELLHPLASAWALGLDGEEPPRFLRERLVPLLREVAPAEQGVSGHYLEVRDAAHEPFVRHACWYSRFADGCERWVRPDLLCCWPFARRAILAPEPPPCPGYDA